MVNFPEVKGVENFLIIPHMSRRLKINLVLSWISHKYECMNRYLLNFLYLNFFGVSSSRLWDVQNHADILDIHQLISRSLFSIAGNYKLHRF